MPDFSWNGVFLSTPIIDWNCNLMNNKSRGWFSDPWFLFIFITYFPNKGICGNHARCLVTTERPHCAGQWLLAGKAVQHLKTSQTCLNCPRGNLRLTSPTGSCWPGGCCSASGIIPSTGHSPGRGVGEQRRCPHCCSARLQEGSWAKHS